MIKAITFLFILLCPPFFAFANSPCDTVINNVSIHFCASRDMFSQDFINRMGTTPNVKFITDATEQNRMKKILSAALNKYPPGTFEYLLKEVYVFDDFEFNGAHYGATYDSDFVNNKNKIYMVDQVGNLSYTNEYLEQSFHHEFSSFVYLGYPRFFDEVTWTSINGLGFEYRDATGGYQSLLNGQTSEIFDDHYNEFGFLAQYSLSSIENDINLIAENLFMPKCGFWERIDFYPKLKMKADIVIKMYNQLNSNFTESYFRSL